MEKREGCAESFPSLNETNEGIYHDDISARFLALTSRNGVRLDSRSAHQICRKYRLRSGRTHPVFPGHEGGLGRWGSHDGLVGVKVWQEEYCYPGIGGGISGGGRNLCYSGTWPQGCLCALGRAAMRRCLPDTIAKRARHDGDGWII